MYRSKNCGHGLDLYCKSKVITRGELMPVTIEQDLLYNLRNTTGLVYREFIPAYCPICGKKVEADNEKEHC